MKILISAYACSPYKGSEPGVGWGVVSELSRFHELWVIVEEEKFRADIECYLEAHPEFAKRVCFFFIRKKRNRWLRKLWPPSYYWYYRRWHKDALVLAESLNVVVGFDLAHQLTMVGFREPGYLWRLDIPFVWGPIGGMGYFPRRFLSVVGAYGCLYYLGYNFFNYFQMNFLARPRLAAKRAGRGLLAATSENRTGTVKYWDCTSTVLSEVGLATEPVAQIRPRSVDEKLHLVWTGQHTPGKALNLALYALAKVHKDVDWELNILGQGAQTAAWKDLADQLGISRRCLFYGWIPRETALSIMETAHVMLITSLRDLSSTVTVEALSLGLPVICLDHCGFTDIITDECGVLIPVTTPSEVIKELAKTIELFAFDEETRQRLAYGALRRAKDFTWQIKAQLIEQVYRAKLAEAGGEIR